MEVSVLPRVYYKIFRVTTIAVVATQQNKIKIHLLRKI